MAARAEDRYHNLLVALRGREVDFATFPALAARCVRDLVGRWRPALVGRWRPARAGGAAPAEAAREQVLAEALRLLAAVLDGEGVRVHPRFAEWFAVYDRPRGLLMAIFDAYATDPGRRAVVWLRRNLSRVNIHDRLLVLAGGRPLAYETVVEIIAAAVAAYHSERRDALDEQLANAVDQVCLFLASLPRAPEPWLLEWLSPAHIETVARDLRAILYAPR